MVDIMFVTATLFINIEKCQGQLFLIRIIRKAGTYARIRIH